MKTKVINFTSLAAMLFAYSALACPPLALKDGLFLCTCQNLKSLKECRKSAALQFRNGCAAIEYGDVKVSKIIPPVGVGVPNVESIVKCVNTGSKNGDKKQKDTKGAL